MCIHLSFQYAIFHYLIRCPVCNWIIYLSHNLIDLNLYSSSSLPFPIFYAVGFFYFYFPSPPHSVLVSFYRPFLYALRTYQKIFFWQLFSTSFNPSFSLSRSFLPATSKFFTLISILSSPLPSHYHSFSSIFLLNWPTLSDPPMYSFLTLSLVVTPS